MRMLVSCSGRKKALIDCLYHMKSRHGLKMDILPGDSDSNCAIKLLDNNFIVTPHNFSSFSDMLNFLKSHNITIVLPTRDAELPFWARYRERFSMYGISIIVSSPEFVELTHQKKKFCKYCEAHGLPVTGEVIESEIEKKQKYYIKENSGSGSHKGFSFLGYELDRYLPLFNDPIIQKFEYGEEISIDGFVSNDGEISEFLPRKRLKISNGESEVTCSFGSKSIVKICKNVIRGQKVSGPVTIQGFLSGSNFKLSEINARIGGASTCGIYSGLDSLFWSILDTVGKLDAGHIPSNYKEVAMVRYKKDELISGSNI